MYIHIYIYIYVRAESVRRRQIEMSVHAIFTYLDNVLTTKVLSYDNESDTGMQRKNNQITVEQYKVKNVSEYVIYDI
jgi:hypothetical protein